MSERKLLKLTYENGLLDAQEDSVRGPGFSEELQNWVPGPHGGLRTRHGWLLGSATSAPSAPVGRGVTRFARNSAPQLVQWASISTTTGDGSETFTMPFSSPTTAGNLLLVCILVSDTAGTVTTPTDFTVVLNGVGGASYGELYVYYRADAPVTENVSLTWTSYLTNRSLAITVLEYEGVATSSPYDKSNFATGNPATPTTAATTQASELVMMFAQSYAGTTSPPPLTADAGWRIADETVAEDGARAVRLQVLDRTVLATGAQTGSVSSSGNVGAAIVTFKGWNTAASPAQNTEKLAAFHDTGTAHSLYTIDPDNLDAGTWSSIESVTADSDVLVACVPAGQRLVYTAKGWTSGRSYDLLTAAAVPQMPPGRCLAWHKQRLWTGGVPDIPTRLFYSETANYAAWPGVNYIEVGEDDGEPIEDCAPYQGGLVIGKENGVWFLVGNNISTFDLTELSGGGAAPGRSICGTPYGVFVAGRAAVYLWTGGGLEIASRPIESTYGLVGSFVTTSYHDQVLYITDEGGTTMWCFDVPTGVWWTETVNGTGENPIVLYSDGGRLLMQPNGASTGSFVNFRTQPSTTRAKDFDDLSETFLAETSELWPVGPDTRITPLHLHLRVRQRGGDSTHTGMTITPIYDGMSYPALTLEPSDVSPSTWRERFDVGYAEGISSVKFRFEQTVPDGEASLFDIEEARLELNIEERA